MNSEKKISNKDTISIIKWIEKKFTNIELRHKLFVVYALIVFVPISFLVFFSLYTSQKELTVQSYENTMNTIMQINKNIEGKLDDYTQVSSQIYTIVLYESIYRWNIRMICHYII